MNVNTSKERNFHTQGQQFAARVLCIVWLLASVSPEGILAAPKRQDAMTPATATSPAAPADTAQDQASALTNKLVSLYSADDKLPKLIEDPKIPAQGIDQYYVRLQAVVQEYPEGAESAAARDKVAGEKRRIEVHQLFDKLDEEGDRQIGKVLLLGGAGIGKTTLMHYISHQWAKGRLWKGKYDYVFRVRLKELLNNNWQSAYSTDDLDEHPLACFIHHCLRNQRSQLPASKKKAFKLCKASEVQSLLEDPASRHSVLLLVDGYDEIASQSQQGITKDIVDAILEQERVIMTSRPDAADKQLRVAFHRQVESQGLDRAGIEHYIGLQFEEEQAKQAGQDLKNFLTKNRQILGMCEVPINTALLCIIWKNIWKDPAIRERLQKRVGEDLKLGELYQKLVVWLGKRYMKKFEGRNHKNLTEEIILHHPVVKTLKEVAYTNFTGEGKEQAAGTLGIKGEYIANTAEKQKTKLESVYQYGLLRVEGRGECLKDKTHYFIHLTFQEYLTALRLSEALSETQGEEIRKVATHIADHRNEPRYLMTLKFLAGQICELKGEKGLWVVQRFWEAVSCNVEGVLELDVASKVGLLMHLMAQSITQGGLDERIPNREKLQKLVDEEVVTDLARWQEQLIASGYKSEALVRKLREVIYQEQPEENISELSAGLEIGLALGSRVVEEEEQPLARHLEKLLDSPAWQVRALAAAKLAQALDDKVDRAQVSRLLGKLIGCYEVENTRQGALAGIWRLAELKRDIVVEELNKSIAQGSAGNRSTVQGLTKQLSELGQDWFQCTKLTEALAQPDIAENTRSQLKEPLEKETRCGDPFALQAALTSIKRGPSSAQKELGLVRFRLHHKKSETREADISLGVELAFHLPNEAIPMLLQDPEPSVREKAKKHFIKRLQDKTVTYSPQNVLVLAQLLQHSAADSDLDRDLQQEATQKLLELAPQVAEKAGLKYLNDHFDALRPGTAITAFLKKVMHQVLAEGAIDQLEADFITNCILQHKIVPNITLGTCLFDLEGSRYQLKDSSEAHLQKIVNSFIEKSKSPLAQQYKEHQSLLKNEGIGLSLAASDIPRAGSVVNNTGLTTNTWHFSVMHLSDHHKKEPEKIFLLLEQRNYVGEHIIKKITYDQGQYTLDQDEALNPKAVDTKLRAKLFGPMEYEGTKPRYYATCYTLSKEAAQELLGKINQQVGPEAQDAYQALHQLALAACEADHAGAEQLALEWEAYVPNAQELKKVDLLKLSQGDAVQVRQDSLAIAEREKVAALDERVESHDNVLDVTGIKDEAEIREKLQALKANHSKRYDYCHAFICTMHNYIKAYRIASTGMFSQELDQGAVMDLLQFGIAAAESIPVVGDFASLLGDLIDKTYETVKTAQQENKVAVLNRIIQDHHLFDKDVELTISRAGLLLAERKRGEIEAAQAATQSILENLLGSSLGSKIENLKHRMLRTYQIAQSPQAGLAIEDVLALLVRMYKEYEILKKQGGELYEQLAALVCTGSLPDLLSQSTAESALEIAIRKKKKTVEKLKDKAGKGLWEATEEEKGKECEQFFEEACVRGYIKDSQPGVTVSDKQVVAMRMVLFRYMCEGIQEDKEESLACAQKFAAKYPALVEKLAKEYPTYFVSQAIARACITDPSLANEVMSHLPN